MKCIIIFIFTIVIFSCSEKQTFESTFKFTQSQIFIENCHADDNECLESFKLNFDHCFKNSNFNMDEISTQTSTIDWSDFKGVEKKMESTNIIQSTTLLSDCLSNSIGGYFAENIRNGGVAVKESNFKITRSHNPAIACLIDKENCDEENRIRIKISTSIKLNSKIVELKNLSNHLALIKSKKPNSFIELIKYNKPKEEYVEKVILAIEQAKYKVSSTSSFYRNK